MSKVVLIGGGSASGKTYVLNKVLERLGNERVAHISLDDYYKDFSVLPMEERAKVNFDHPKAFDWKLMVKQITDLKNGKTIEKPKYDFTIHGRSPEIEVVEPKDLIIVEGIMALVNKDLRALGDLKVFINASSLRRARPLRHIRPWCRGTRPPGWRLPFLTRRSGQADGR